MKRKVRLALLGAMLQGGMQAAAQEVDAEPSLGSVHRTDAGQPATKKQKTLRGKKNKATGSGIVKPAASMETEAAKREPEVKPDAVSVTPPETIEQSVQVKGVRG